MIETMENLSIAIILALGFFVNGSLNEQDYIEFIQANLLSTEHLVSASHFLQEKVLFAEELKLEIMKW